MILVQLWTEGGENSIAVETIPFPNAKIRD